MKKTVLLYLLILCMLYACNSNSTVQDEESQWSEYLGGPDRNHYSSLEQINVSNIHRLKKIWEYKSGDSGQVQCNPIIVDGIIFGVTASDQVFALDAATGQQKWRYVQTGAGSANVNRGLTYWQEGTDKRILFGFGSELYALNAETGLPIHSFGAAGR